MWLKPLLYQFFDPSAKADGKKVKTNSDCQLKLTVLLQHTCGACILIATNARMHLRCSLIGTNEKIQEFSLRLLYVPS